MAGPLHGLGRPSVHGQRVDETTYAVPPSPSVLTDAGETPCASVATSADAWPTSVTMNLAAILPRLARLRPCVLPTADPSGHVRRRLTPVEVVPRQIRRLASLTTPELTEGGTPVRATPASMRHRAP